MSQITFVLLLLWTSGTTLASVHLHSPEDVTTVHNITGRCEYGALQTDSGCRRGSRLDLRGPRPACGVPAIKPKVPGCLRDGLGIINGEEAVPHSWPWQVSLQYSTGSQFCGGSLINKDWVVTAAHCEVSKSNHLILGQHNLKNNISIQNMRVGKVINHPKYSNTTLDYDIALIKLQSPAQLNKHVSPVCVAVACDNICAGTKCVATGWGLTRYKPPQFPNKLQQVCLPTTSSRKCRSKYTGQITSRMFCAGAGGADTCNGDSGGPLVYKKNGAWTLIGITSWGQEGCDSNSKPGVYTSIPKVRAWMDRTMANN